MRPLRRKLLTVAFVILIASPASAAFLETNFVYFTDSATIASTASSTNDMFVDVAAGFNLDKDGQYQVGWEYAMFSVTQNSGSTNSTYSSTQMGPKFNLYFNRVRTWSFSVAYNLVTSANYSASGSSAELWKGTAFKFDLGYTWRVSDSFGVGLRLNYAMANYSDKFVNGTNYSAVSNNRTHLYPSIYMGLDF